MLSAETYTERRHQLARQVNGGMILLLGNEESSMNYKDNLYPFRQDSTFLYYAGIDQPHLALLIDTESGQTILFGDDIDVDAIVWMGERAPLAAVAAEHGISAQRPYDELVGVIRAAAQSDRNVHYLPPYRPEQIILLAALTGNNLELIEDQYSRQLVQAIVKQRSVKSSNEVKEMEAAVNISAAMHRAAMEQARPGERESKIVGVVQGIAAAASGALAYPPIVSKDGQILHNHYHGNILAEGQLLLNDFGAETGNHYASDITRTFPISATFSGMQRDIYEIVLQAQEEAIKAMAPGTRFRDVHLLAAKVIVEGLKALNIMQGDTDEAVAAGAHALFFPHGLGHMIGLDVHDMENLGEDQVGYGPDMQRSPQFGLKALRLGRSLQSGYVVTVEPGIYFIPALIRRWQSEQKHAAFINYATLDFYEHFGGIRIEDDILITEQGHRVLGNPIPKQIGELEEIRKKALLD